MPDYHTLYFGLVVIISLFSSISISWTMGASSAEACQSGNCSRGCLLYPMSFMFLLFTVFPISIAANALQVADLAVVFVLLGGYFCCITALLFGLRSLEQERSEPLAQDTAE